MINDSHARVRRLTVSSLLIALAAADALVSSMVPFFSMPTGGSFTIGSMLPIVVIAYLYGTRFGLLAGGVYALVQILTSFRTVGAFFLPDSDFGAAQAICILFIDYILAYTLIGLAGLARKKNTTAALVCGALVAVGVRYLCHTLSGAIFYGAWGEWFFSSPESAASSFAASRFILEHFHGRALGVVYSMIYNAIYLVPEAIVSCLLALPLSRLRVLRAKDH